MGPTSIRLVWAALSGVLQAAVEDRRLARNPCRSSTVGPPAAAPGRVEVWPPERVLAVRAAMPDRYRVLVEIGAGLGLRQGEALGLSGEDIDFGKEIVHVRRQAKMVRTKLCFALPKGRRVRDVPLQSSVSRAVQGHMGAFAPVPVTLPWDDPCPPQTPSEELEAGETGVSLARWLGHSDPGFALRKCSRFLPPAGARGSAAVDAVFA